MAARTSVQQGELVYGVHPILELLKARKRKIVSVYTTKPEPRVWPSIKKLLPAGVNIQYVAKDVLTRIAGSGDHQGVLAWVSPFGYRTKPFDPTKDKFLLLLDGVQDVRNLGAILRSAYCTNVDGVIIPKKSTAPINAPALKASAGLAEHMQIWQPASSKQALEELKKAGYNIYLTTLDQTESAQDVSYDLPLVVVIGSEGSGISPEIKALGRKITLPQRQKDISYNASVAAGIFLFLIASSKRLI